MKAPVTPHLDDEDAERVRVAHEEKIRELQAMPASSLAVLSGIQLANATTTAVPHKLGRKPTLVMLGAVQGAASAGYINLVSRDTQYLNLQANGYGATITLDIGVL